MEISKQEMDTLHIFVRPIITGEKASEMIADRQKEIMASYKIDEEEKIKKYSREQRMKQAVSYMSFLSSEEKHIIEELVNKYGKDAVQEQYIYYLYEMMGTEYDMPEEHVIVMLYILKGAIEWALMVSMQDEISEMLSNPFPEGLRAFLLKMSPEQRKFVLKDFTPQEIKEMDSDCTDEELNDWFGTSIPKESNMLPKT